MYYNADLLEIAPELQYTRLGFIDDIAFGVQGKSGRSNIRTLQKIMKETENWRRKHGAQFERSKYILVHFTRNRNTESNTPLPINGFTIEPSEEAKYLGVIFDKELRFHTHLQYVAKKGTTAAMALSRIAKCNWGAPFKHIRQLFLSVIAPRMDYAAVIWHRPTHDGRADASTQIRKMSTIQRLAMKAMLGCFKTTPTAAMEIESGIQPSWLRLQTKVLLAITRMQTLSEKHPMKEWLSSALRTRTAAISYRSNLENALQQFPYMCETIESIEPFIRPPWWESKAIIRIEKTKPIAKATHDELQARSNAAVQTIYTDGSGIENKIGAAAYIPATKEAIHHHLGSEVQFNVYAAELSAIYISLNGRWDLHQDHCRIYSDSQAALRALDRPRKQSGQEIIKDILDQIDQITNGREHLQIEMVWIPGHSDIEGNEQADTEAKKAAINPALKQRHRHKPLKSGRARHIKAIAKEQWQRKWHNTTTAKTLRHITSTKSKRIRAGPGLYNEISSRNTSTTMAQLRTGHCWLNLYRYRFGHAKSPYCKCGYGKENVEHFLLECRNYKAQRKKLREAVGAGKMKVAHLLGDPTLVKYTMEYVKMTGRLDE
jgi:ribonuclease HI